MARQVAFFGKRDDFLASPSSLREKLRKGAARTFLLNSASLLLVVLMHLVLARRLSRDEYGAFSFGLALAGLLATAACLGWPPVLVRWRFTPLNTPSPWRSAC